MSRERAVRLPRRKEGAPVPGQALRPPHSASAMASSGGAGSAAAAANLNAVRETMDSECPFRPFYLAAVPQSQGPGAGRGPRGLQVHVLPRSASLEILPRDPPGPQSGWLHPLRVVSPFLRSLSRARCCGHTSARRAPGPSRTRPHAPPVSRLEGFPRSAHLAPSPAPSPRDLSRASSSHGWSLHHAPSAPVPRIPSPALLSRAPPTPRAASSEGVASGAPQTELPVDSGFRCLVTAPSLLVPCAAAGPC